jgi:hypothetical protein
MEFECVDQMELAMGIAQSRTLAMKMVMKLGVI